MPITIEKLRRWMLLAAGAVVLVVCGLLLFAAHERKKILKDLPAKLGVEIEQQTNAFTYSQSWQGKTLFTIHAAKAVQLKDGGKIRLHDVVITLYGRKQDRADRISGVEFDYDPKAGIARAVGEVQLDLQAPAKAASAAKDSSKAEVKQDAAKEPIHVKTSGLIFYQKEQRAETDEAIEFRFSGVQGSAMGAEYDADQGLITLRSAVNAKGAMQGRPLTVKAAHAVLNRDTNRAVLTQARYAADGQTITANAATIQMRTDGTAERILADGQVLMTAAQGGTLAAEHVDAQLNPVSQPKDIRATGGVRYVDNESLREAQGTAAAAHIVFDAHGTMQVAEMETSVAVHERERAAVTTAWSERELSAGKAVLRFAPVAAGTEMARPSLQDVQATGAAQLATMTPVAATPKQKAGVQRTEIAGDALRAVFAAKKSSEEKNRLSSVHGVGHTRLIQTAVDGSVTRSMGDTLEIAMQGTRAAAAKQEAASIERAIQQGHVAIVRTSAPASAKNGSLQEMHASGGRAEFAGADQSLVLTGSGAEAPQVNDGTMLVMARRITLLRQTGDAALDGDVRGSFASQSAQGVETQPPVHVVADRAQVHQSAQGAGHPAEQRATFYGTMQRRARLWQEGAQVEAPVLELDRVKQTLTAHGETHDTAPVKTVFSGAKTGASSVQVMSQQLVYTDAARRGDFTGGVQIESGEGTVHALRAVVMLEPAKKDVKGGVSAPVVLSGNVQRVTATGAVRLEQGERKGFGEQLVYTPNPAVAPGGDAQQVSNPKSPGKSPTIGHFVLTGTPAVPPRLVDPAKGTITGTSLIFNSGDDSVVVAGDGAGTKQRVRTEIQVER